MHAFYGNYGLSTGHKIIKKYTKKEKSVLLNCDGVKFLQ